MQNFWNFIVEKQGEIFQQTLQHLYLTAVALLFALVLGLGLGILLARYKKISGTALGILGVIQTIPSLALLGFMLPLIGIGALPAIIALFLYALLPIVRNTYTGIIEVEKSVVEAAKGMGMSPRQILMRVELPLAMPTIFAGIRTATVINVGIATLCALIAAGGLGEFIFRGIALNNSNMILAGAIPAALLALLLDNVLALVQKNINYLLRPMLLMSLVGIVVLLVSILQPLFVEKKIIVAGFDSEFKSRPDGYPSLKEKYGLYFEATRDLDAGLMYLALKNQKIDVISGYATEGKIDAFQLKVLKDDRNCFPPYYVAPVLNGETLQKYPFLEEILNKIAGKISDEKMRQLNYQVDEEKQSTQKVAKEFLTSLGFQTQKRRDGKPDLIIGGKKFTEQYILLDIFKCLIENYSDLTVAIKGGLGGTQICYEALRKGEIDIYPEYTGTALLVILKADEGTQKKISTSSEAVYQYIKKTSAQRHNTIWLKALGFNNTYCLMMRQAQAEALGIESITDLKNYIDRH